MELMTLVNAKYIQCELLLKIELLYTDFKFKSYINEIEVANNKSRKTELIHAKKFSERGVCRSICIWIMTDYWGYS